MALGETCSTELLGYLLHLAGGDSLNVHLHEGCYQGPLASLIPAEKLGLKCSFSVLRNQELQGSYSGFQPSWFMAITVTTSSLCSFIEMSLKVLSHLLFQESLAEILHDPP